MAAAALLGLVADGVERGGRQLGAQPHAVDDVFDAGGAKARRHGRTLYSERRPECPAAAEA